MCEGHLRGGKIEIKGLTVSNALGIRKGKRCLTHRWHNSTEERGRSRWRGHRQGTLKRAVNFKMRKVKLTC
jgi:hypothetical protein